MMWAGWAFYSVQQDSARHDTYLQKVMSPCSVGVFSVFALLVQWLEVYGVLVIIYLRLLEAMNVFLSQGGETSTNMSFDLRWVKAKDLPHVRNKLHAV